MSTHFLILIILLLDCWTWVYISYMEFFFFLSNDWLLIVWPSSPSVWCQCHYFTAPERVELMENRIRRWRRGYLHHTFIKGTQHCPLSPAYFNFLLDQAGSDRVTRWIFTEVYAQMRGAEDHFHSPSPNVQWCVQPSWNPQSMIPFTLMHRFSMCQM